MLERFSFTSWTTSRGGSFTEPARKTVNVLIASANLVVALCCMGKSGHAYIEAAFFDAVGIHHVLEAVHFLEDDLTVEEDALTVDSEFCPVAGSAEEGKPHFLSSWRMMWLSWGWEI